MPFHLESHAVDQPTVETTIVDVDVTFVGTLKDDVFDETKQVEKHLGNSLRGSTYRRLEIQIMRQSACLEEFSIFGW